MNHHELLESVRAALHARRMSHRTEEAYVYWIRRFLQHHSDGDPRAPDCAAIEDFLVHLREQEGTAASTRNLALNAVHFLYRDVLGRFPECLDTIPRARRPCRTPPVFTRREVQCILEGLSGAVHVAAALLYGAGLRLTECLAMCVRDIDFVGMEIVVRNVAGGVERRVPLPPWLALPLREQMRAAHALYLDDLEEQQARTRRPSATVAAAFPWELQHVFPAARRGRAGRDAGRLRRHLDPSTVQRALRRAIGACGITGPGCAQALRNSAAAHMLEDGRDVHDVQRVLGHGDVRTTKMYSRAADP